MKPLTVSSIAKFFGATTVFHELSFELAAGACLQVSGSNGAGKSTLLSCLAGIMQPDEGSIELDGKNFSLSKHVSVLCREHGIGYLPQCNLLYPALGVGENIELLSTLFSVPVLVVDRLICSFQLESYLNQTLATCSQGVCRRVGLVRALLTSSKYLLLDEPFAHLDAESVKSCRQVLAEYRENGALIILASHHSFKEDQLVTHTFDLDSAEPELIEVAAGNPGSNVAL